MSEETGGWAVASARPLAFGGWEFLLTCGAVQKRMEWWPSDSHLTFEQRPFRAAPVQTDSGKGARRAAEALVALLNEEEDAA